MWKKTTSVESRLATPGLKISWALYVVPYGKKTLCDVNGSQSKMYLLKIDVHLLEKL